MVMCELLEVFRVGELVEGKGDALLHTPTEGIYHMVVIQIPSNPFDDRHWWDLVEKTMYILLSCLKLFVWPFFLKGYTC